jgi:putative nucleotidyltransferase with HDIG domain
LDVEIPAEARTAERVEQARRAVDDVYVFDGKAAERIDAETEEAFARGSLPGSPDQALSAALRGPHGAETIRQMRGILRAILSEKIVARRDTLPQARAITVRDVGGTSETTLRDLSRIVDFEEAKSRTREAASGLTALDAPLKGKAADWLAGQIQPTLAYDLGETRRRMEEAARQVPVLYSRIPKGTALLRKGSPLTRDTIRQIVAVQQAGPKGFDPTASLGTLLIILFITFFFWRYAIESQRHFKRIRRLFPFLVLTLLLHAALARAGIGLVNLLVKNLEFPYDRPQTLWYLIPTASGAVLVALLANDRIATAYSLFATAFFALIFDWDLSYVMFVLLTHLAGIHGLTAYRTRTALMRSGLIIGFSGAAVVAGLDAITSGFKPWQVCVTDSLFALLGGVIGVPLVVAFLLPIFEWLFGVLTDIRLLELSNLDNPLLSELALRAPGSYNHSIIVGTLAEAAADAIGANSLFCRVAAFYHDIGKMKMPEYYIENQRPGENPHDRLAPSMSALIISNHVKEGIRLGRDHGLPQPILDIIPQHHGTRVMTYFYEKAKAAASASGAPVPNPEEFRHPGPKPQTKEAAIFMLSDSVEAAARTVAEPTDERFRDLIRQIAGRSILDGQFDACDLTFRDLDLITEAFVRTLGSVYHHRIDYPTFIFAGAAKASGRAGSVGARKRGGEGPA